MAPFSYYKRWRNVNQTFSLNETSQKPAAVVVASLLHSSQRIYYEVYLLILKTKKLIRKANSPLKMRTGQVLRYWGDEVGTRATNNGKMKVKSSS